LGGKGSLVHLQVEEMMDAVGGQRPVSRKTPYPVCQNRKKLTLENYQKDPEVAGRRVLAWKMARIASKILKEKYGAKKVVLFGSLANEKRFTPWSDVDLSVSGMPPQDYYQAARNP
jgi:hypothetical protein